jgi:hypothetical protein
MNKRRKKAPKLKALTSRSESDCRCWFCGSTMNVPVTRYEGLCMSCWWDFHEDDIILDTLQMEAMP